MFLNHQGSSHPGVAGAATQAEDSESVQLHSRPKVLERQKYLEDLCLADEGLDAWNFRVFEKLFH